MNESQCLVIHALGDPAKHAAPMAIDAIPHDLAYESSYLTETLNPVELSHSHRHFVAANLGDQFTSAGGNEVWLPGCRAEPRIRLHALHQQFEIERRQIKVE